MTWEWARTGTGSQRILTTYTYGFQDGSGTNGVGDLIGVVYSHDPVSTPSLSYVYDRLGRRITATQGGMTTTLSYDDASDFLGESYSGGVLDGFSVSSGYDSIDRRTSLTASGSSALLTNTFGYDSASELTSVSYGPFSANYSYVANSPLVGQIVCQSNSTVQLTTTKQYDNLDRLWSIVSMPGASGQWPISYVYQYNQANQRTQASQYDNSFWKYDYDALGQVISGEKHWSDNTHVPGEQFQYAFDDIGNRTSTESGGDQNGNNLRSATYSVNNLNQYTSRTVPNGFDMLGQVNVGATVWVNGSVSDYRRGEFFQKGLTVTNSSQAVWLPVTIGASNGATTNFVAGHEFVVETPENYTYDADGNLTQDGRWNYTWDAENRLIEMTSLSGAPSGSQYKLDFTYDYQGRRIQKLVSTNNGSWVPFYTNRFLYDGWNLIAILNPDGSTAESFVWGSDLAGSAGLPRQSAATAGGVGGLLAVKVSNGANAGTYFYAFDGNGNVAGLVSAGNGTVSAEYEYGPFGELLRATGPMAKVNPFRFSTKYQDDETDLIYYGRRYLKTSTGGWLSRDPIEEGGGANLYAFVNNSPIGSVDRLGLSTCGKTCGVAYFELIDKGWTLTGGAAHYNFDIKATFLSDSKHDPSACLYRQWIQVTASVNGKAVTQSSGTLPFDGKLHIDSNPWSTNTTIQNAVGAIYQNSATLPNWLSSDVPGWSSGISAGDSISWTSAIVGKIVDVNQNYKVVAQKSFKYSVSGTYPNVTTQP